MVTSTCRISSCQISGPAGKALTLLIIPTRAPLSGSITQTLMGQAWASSFSKGKLMPGEQKPSPTFHYPTWAERL